MKNRLLKQIDDSKNELSKVFFPSNVEIQKYFINVIVVVGLMSIYLTIIDTTLNKIINLIIN